MSTLLEAIVILVGGLILALCVFGLCRPDRLLKIVKSVFEGKAGMSLAVGARIVLGVVLILVAPESRFPFAFQLLGWVALIAAVVLPLVGRSRISNLLEWFECRPRGWIRGWLLFGLMFGGFLIFGEY